MHVQDGKTEYKSVTVAEDSTAEEFMDFYLDDHTRTKWVSSTSRSGPSARVACHIRVMGPLQLHFNFLSISV